MNTWRLGLVGLVLLGGCMGAPAATVTTADTCVQVKLLKDRYLDEWAVEERRLKKEANIDADTLFIPPTVSDALFRNSLEYWERTAILAEENPDCFTLAERTEIEAEYRAWVRLAEERRSG